MHAGKGRADYHRKVGEIKYGRGPHNNYSQNGHEKGGSIREATRESIGRRSAVEHTRWLKDKKSKWDLGQLIHEFCGKNNDNWKLLTTSDDGKVLMEVFELLGRCDVRESPESATMYFPFSTPAGLATILQFLEDGPLREDAVEDASKGRGGTKWCGCVKGVVDLLETIMLVLRLFGPSVKSTLVSTILAVLLPRVDVLCPSVDDEEEDIVSSMEPWDVNCSVASRGAHCLAARALRDLFQAVSNKLKVLKITEKEKKAVAERKAEVEDRAKSDARINARQGNMFLNEVRHDKDYLQMSAVPTPEQMLSKAASKLPQNLVVPVRNRSGNENEDEDLLDDGHYSAAVEVVVPAKFQYRSIDHYLNTHFLLMSEDCLAQLKKGIAEFRERLCESENAVPEIVPTPTAEALDKAVRGTSKKTNSGGFNFYTNVEVVQLETTRQGLGFVMSFTIPSGGHKVDWESSSRFMNGTLLCLSADGTFNASTLVVATVMRGVQLPKDKHKQKSFVPTITIEVDAASFDRFDTHSSYTMLESPVFFEAYRPVLKALQELGSGDVPMVELLLGHSNKVDPPQYIINPPAESDAGLRRAPAAVTQGWQMGNVFPSYPANSCGAKVFNPMQTDSYGRTVKMPYFASNPPLDESQRAAIALALSSRFALIQGPPGCGKTFVGVLITRLLLENRHLRKPRPIVFICQTNHALDQILEHVYKFETNMVRIGGRSESPTMQQLSLQAKQQGQDRLSRTSAEFEARNKLNVLLAKIKADIAQTGLSKSLTGNALSLSDKHLARLRTIMKSYGKEHLVDSLVDQCANDVAEKSFNLLKSGMVQKNKGNEDNSTLPYWTSDINSWFNLSPRDRIRMLAAHSSENLSSKPSGNLSIFDAWLYGKVHNNAYSLSSVPLPPAPSNKLYPPAYDEQSDDEMEYDENFEFFADRRLDSDNLNEDYFDSYKKSRGGDKVEEASAFAADTPLSQPLPEFEKAAGLSAQALHLLHHPNLLDLYALKKEDRRTLAEAMIKLLCADGSDGAQSYMEQYKAALLEENKYFARIDAATLRSAAVIGLTTTGAAKHGATLRALGSEVLIVEEAAEVLEGHILAALTPSTKHVILIGDHQQLRPQVNEYNLATRHNLEISMFERLINCGFPHVTLSTQRRMHPEISSLITPAIYRNLRDAKSVHGHAAVSGVRNRVHFISHTHLEDSETLNDKLKEVSEQGGRSNTYEAEMIVALVQYLLLNGYTAKQIVVLSMYNQQLRLLRRLAKSEQGNQLIAESASDVRMTTTDNYQGEECEIVLLSLVRSNTQDKAGFVKIANRVCVALSRARNGMYVFGNFDMIRRTSELWDNVCSAVEGRDQIGPALCLECANHPQSAIEASTPAHFKCAPNGGCMARCGGAFPLCGHKCDLVCHPMKHDQIHCLSVCEKPRAPECTHPCPQPCWQECLPCAVPVMKDRRSCGHNIKVKCSDDVETARCTKPCPFATMACGHVCQEECSHNHDAVLYKCRQACLRTKLTCNHPCSKQCSDVCGDCNTVVVKTRPCGHTAKVFCSKDVSTIPCKEKCTKKLAGCDHLCTKLCHEACEEVCQVVVKRKQPLCQSKLTHSVNVKCGETVPEVPCKDNCGGILDCKHSCPGTCGTCRPVGFTTAVHPPCKKSCDKELPCNHKCGGHSCGTPCPPCKRPCAMKCSHQKCGLTCGAPCEPCEQLCTSKCSHLDTAAALCCANPHDIVPSETAILCEMSCPLLLNCKHPCAGLCGEVCPAVCKVCQKGKFKDAMLALDKATQITSDSRLIMLGCGHSYEACALDAHMLKQAAQSHYPRCPSCKVTVQGVFRYNALVRRNVAKNRPPYFEARERILREDFEKDMKLKNFGAIESRTRLRLADDKKSKAEAAHENPLLEYQLGRALIEMSQFNPAHKALVNALSTATTARLKAECAEALGLMFLQNSKNYGKAVDFLQQAVDLGATRESAKAHLLTAHASHRQEQEKIDKKAKEAARQRAEVATVASVIARPVGPVAQLGDQFSTQEVMREQAARQRTAQEAEDAEEMAKSGGNVLHLAVLRGRIDDIRDLVAHDPALAGMMQDSFKNTPLHWASKLRNTDALLELVKHSPWHLLNLDGKTFIDEALGNNSADHDDLWHAVNELAHNACISDAEEPSKRWAAMRAVEGWRCDALDKLMLQVGLDSVKSQALLLFCSVKADLKRPKAAQVLTGAMLHFAFVGNPGVGKTTVARIFAQMLKELGLRGDKFVETTGQKLLQAGSSKFPATLQSATPGVLFIDEVYQLNPKADREGMAITNDLMDVTESDRTVFSVIIAGYKDDVCEKFFTANQGLPSRFTEIVSFEDFDEHQLRTIFLSMVEAKGWKLQAPVRGKCVDIATIVARRLARGRSKKGFGNARAVRNLLEKALKVADSRLQQERRRGVQHSDDDTITLFREDVLGKPFKASKSKLFRELDEMLGLAEVKTVIRNLATMVETNLQSEEAGEEVLEISLHRIFLGNPGTGKTTVAKLYGKLLAEMGYLSNGEVVVVGASKLTGSTVGSSAKATNELIDNCAGKVLVIDEAYNLATSIYGKEALDVLVERVQGGAEDFAVILCGYNDEMRNMLRTCNLGLARRFKIEDAFQFADYSDAELATIMVSKADAMGLLVAPEIAQSVVRKVLSKQRSKPNFGNAGAVINLLDRAKERVMGRSTKSKVKGKWEVLEEDLRNLRLSSFDANSTTLRDLDKMLGLAEVKQAIRSLATMAEENVRSEKAGEDVLEISLHRIFLGNPGTGKTTVAKLYGKLLAEMGYLSNGEVVVVGASQLTGAFVGSSAKATNELIDNCAGKVLVIDEAYNLATSIYGKEALDVLVERVQGGAEDFAVILCGYNDAMRNMVSTCNAGLARRFKIEDAFQFADYSDAELEIIMVSKADAMGLLVAPEIAQSVVRKVLSKQRSKPNFGNAGAVINLLDRAKERVMGRSTKSKVKGKWEVLEEDMEDREENDIVSGFDDLSISTPAELGGVVESLHALQSAQEHQLGDVGNNYNHKQVAEREEVLLTNTVVEEEEVEVAEEAVEEEVEEEFELVDAPFFSSVSIWAALEEACAELNYSLKQLASFLRTADYPVELLQLIKNKVGSDDVTEIKQMLDPQRVEMLARVEFALHQIEQERLRLLEEERRAQDERAKEALREKKRQQERIQERLRQIGRCPMNFEWIATGGGYRCAGGSHFVTAAQVNHID